MVKAEGVSTDKKRKGSSSDSKERKLAKKRKWEKGSKNKKEHGAEKPAKKKGKKANSKQQNNEHNEGNDTEPKEQRTVWSKSKKKRIRKSRAKMTKKSEELATSESNHKKPANRSDSKSKKDGGANEAKENRPTKNETTKKGTSKLQNKYAARLSGSRFRILNEELYTTTSSVAFDNFQLNPELFDQYHEGFRHQVEQWPSNPVEVMFNWLNKKYANSSKTTIVADFGCGDAELANRLKVTPSSDKKEKKSKKDELPFKVHSFDLVAKSDLVTACDMANVPLEDKSVDVAIFCLALMGTNVADFLLEAHRVLKDNGKVKIAEVRSRFESASGKDDLDGFVQKLEQLGFDCKRVDRSNKMFVLMELKKNGKKPDRDLDVKIKPCIYKRR